MNLINISQTENGFKVDGRELHEFLEVGSRFNDWIRNRVEKYGFIEGEDFRAITKNLVSGGQQFDYELSIDMAKELCMVENNDKGRQARKYFIECEKRLKQSNVHYLLPQNYKEALISLVAEVEKNEALTAENAQLQAANHEQEEIIHQLQPKASYCDTVLYTKDLLSTTIVAKDYGLSAYRLNEILHELGIQYRSGPTWVLYQKYADKGYAQTKTHIVNVDKSKPSLYWTQKGRMFIYELLKKEKGILPVMERETA